MIEGLVVTGLDGEEKRLRKALKILGDDSWEENHIISFVKTFGCGIQYSHIDDTYIRYDGESSLFSEGLTVITYKELKTLSKASVGEKTHSYSGITFAIEYLRKKFKEEGYFFLAFDGKEWVNTSYLFLNIFEKYKLINKKHEEVLKHFLNGGEVERFNTITEEWELLQRESFIKYYKETFDYRIHKKTPIIKKVKMIDVLKMCLEREKVEVGTNEYWIKDGNFYIGVKGSSCHMYTSIIEISELSAEFEILDESN